MVRPGIRLLLVFAALLPGALLAADSFRIAEYNIENYLSVPSGTRIAKPEAAKAKVRESILALKPDVLALAEMGTTNDLFELQSALKTNGLDLPCWEHVTGFDTNIHVAILSRFPITARRPHTNDSFLLGGRRFQVSRGFAEVDVRVSTNFSFTMIAAHLKSRRTIPSADEAELRFEEAKILRGIIDARLAANPELNLVVLGDFNDIPSSEPVKTILGGRGRTGLVDTRPTEKNGDNPSPSDHRLATREISWTHYYSKDEIYSRVDYILLSRAMARVWDPAGTQILALPNWGTGSDHRPIVAAFRVNHGPTITR